MLKLHNLSFLAQAMPGPVREGRSVVEDFVEWIDFVIFAEGNHRMRSTYQIEAVTESHKASSSAATRRSNFQLTEGGRASRTICNTSNMLDEREKKVMNDNAVRQQRSHKRGQMLKTVDIMLISSRTDMIRFIIRIWEAAVIA